MTWARAKTATSIVVLVLGLLLAAPAQAKTGDIDHIVIKAPGRDKPVTVLGAMLNGQLAQYEQSDLYSPLLRGKTRDLEWPPGDLGLAYDFTYVFWDVYDDPVRVHETVYLDAVPRVAFTPAGQTVELYPEIVRPVSSGWRPFPERGANAIEQLMEEALRPVSEPYPLPFDPFSLALFAAPVLIIAGGLWFFSRRKRRAARPVA